MKHALVIGGSGMLAGTVRWLEEVGYHVSIIGRDAEKMRRLTEQSPDRLSAILVDYQDSLRLQEALQRSIAVHGDIDLVVAWIHSDAADALPSVLSALRGGTDVFHVLGSRANSNVVRSGLVLSEGVRYRQVQLGHQVVNGERRWLTHEEIAGGVVEAIQQNKSHHVVGIVNEQNE
ncbi:short-chain dehydrogenase [Exiguobacterium sp. SH1S21]|uniref:short-chain dehydrogenase n=1 Tax=unclassified Exiguobacterium TaxID=2644629 RepID=UPI00104079EC|nr:MULTISPECIES: short-chain dehydrogenase [unclassified Exiguobacterium]TCI54115.1 short-chain dehydrogenase [Exiguobacterium sp. SH1S21]TCI69787.1 short-chain dehydrogenase [Exiguobacterium sp. SH0S7]